MNVTFKNVRDVELHGVPPGGAVSLPCDDQGTPKGPEAAHFRKRLREGDFAPEQKPARKGGTD
ncbi:MAG: hypothetical protein AAF360_02155 [Pseudomonadota bacterium]